MNKTTKIAIAFAAFAGVAGAVAHADNWGGKRHHGMMYGNGPGMMRGMDPSAMFDEADADKSGDITFEEFAAAAKTRFGGADANGDGKFTVAEVAAQIEKMRTERMAKRIIERFDVNGDGELTADEIETNQKKLFAMMDRNDDGKLEKGEGARSMMDRHGMRGWGHGPRGWGNN